MRKERLSVLGRLAGGVAHQIRNPLGAIKNAAYGLQRRVREASPTAFDEAAAGDVSRSLAIVHDEVQRANQIITDLLDYARVRVPVRRPTSVVALIKHALGAQGALFNVLRNAVEAMPNGGTLTVETALREGVIVVTIARHGRGHTERGARTIVRTAHHDEDATARTLIEGQGGAIECVRSDAQGTRFEVTVPSS